MRYPVTTGADGAPTMFGLLFLLASSFGLYRWRYLPAKALLPPGRQPRPWLAPNTGYERSRTATCFSGKYISRLGQYQTRRKARHAWTAHTRAGPQINWLLFAGEPIALMQSRPRRSFNPTQRNRLLTLALTLTPTIGPAFKSLVGNGERLAEALIMYAPLRHIRTSNNVQRYASQQNT
jgi:hypothetical protein